MEANVKTLAETKRRLLEAGMVTLGQVATWADDRIAEIEKPPYWLIAVSTARSWQDARDALAGVEGIADTAVVWRDVARSLLEVLDREPKRDSEIAKHLYYLGMNKEAPALDTRGELMSFWDSIDLARDGVYGDLATERQRMRTFLVLCSIEGAAQPGAGPDDRSPSAPARRSTP